MGPINGALLALGARLTSIVDWRLTGKNSPEPIVRQQSMPHSKTLTGMARIGARKKAGIAGKGETFAVCLARLGARHHTRYFGASLKTQTEPPCSR
jgi:hypothetical protein